MKSCRYTFFRRTLFPFPTEFSTFLENFPSFSSTFNTLPNDNFVVESKSKGFEDNEPNVTEKLKMVLGRVENIVGKGENAVSPFPTMFQKPSYIGSLNVVIVC